MMQRTEWGWVRKERDQSKMWRLVANGFRWRRLGKQI